MVGLSGAKRLIRRVVTTENGVHAVLFYGAHGSGKTELALTLAEAWLCQAPLEDGACGECRACLSFGRDANVDLLTIEPKGASSIITLGAVEEVADPDKPYPVPIRTFFRTPPLASRHKVVIMTDAHRMNNATASALLKTLEEPHAHAKLILTTDSVGSVLPTILSRCLAVACALPEANELANLLPGADPTSIRLAEGAPGRLKTIATDAAKFARIADFGKRLLKRAPTEALIAAEEFRTICDGIGALDDRNARSANAQGLALLAIYLAREPEADPEWTQAVTEAHRRILGNGNAAMVLEALFASMLVR